MRRSIPLLFSVLIILCVHSCALDKKKKDITVFTASSVTDVMSAISEEFKMKKGISLRINFASSGILARQIESGADCDYYISASKSWLDYVASLSQMNAGKVTILSQNRMALIVPLSSKLERIDRNELTSLDELFEGRISIGDPAHVPAGKYAMEIFAKYNLESNLTDRILPAKDVRDALFMVEMGEVEMGIVYISDALKSKKVKVVYEFLKDDANNISCYGIAAKEESEHLKAFMSFLQSVEAKQIWKNHGFIVE